MIESGFYFAISAALQRRVWFGDHAFPVFPNQYLLLCAPAGVGKSLVTDAVKALLSFNKKAPINPTPTSAFPQALDSGPMLRAALASVDGEPIFPAGPDSNSYELFVNKLARSTQGHVYAGPNGAKQIYAHASMYLCLNEFSSVFKQNAEDMVTFLLTCWSGTGDYTRETLSRGKDYVKSPCVSMIAGTTPDNFQKLTKFDIIGTGLSRRMNIVYSEHNAFEQLLIPARTAQQSDAFFALTAYLKLLHSVFGRLTYSPEALGFLNEWWIAHKAKILSFPTAVQDYEANKNVHIHKVAIAHHYATNPDSKEINLATAQWAVDYLTRVDTHRINAIAALGRNELSPISRRMSEFINQQPSGCPRNKLLVQFFPDASVPEIDACLTALEEQGKVSKTTSRGVIVYKGTKYE